MSAENHRYEAERFAQAVRQHARRIAEMVEFTSEDSVDRMRVKMDAAVTNLREVQEWIENRRETYFDHHLNMMEREAGYDAVTALKNIAAAPLSSEFRDGRLKCRATRDELAEGMDSVIAIARKAMREQPVAQEGGAA